jgi:hypothetical protein
MLDFKLSITKRDAVGLYVKLRRWESKLGSYGGETSDDHRIAPMEADGGWLVRGGEDYGSG